MKENKTKKTTEEKNNRGRQKKNLSRREGKAKILIFQNDPIVEDHDLIKESNSCVLKKKMRNFERVVGLKTFGAKGYAKCE